MIAESELQLWRGIHELVICKLDEMTLIGEKNHEEPKLNSLRSILSSDNILTQVSGEFCSLRFACNEASSALR
jgi:hypothetical protein